MSLFANNNATKQQQEPHEAPPAVPVYACDRCGFEIQPGFTAFVWTPANAPFGSKERRALCGKCIQAGYSE